MCGNGRGAVCGERVVEPRPFAHLIDGFHVVQKAAANVFARRAHSINVHVLLRLPVRRPHSNHVALVGNHVDELVLPKKTGEGRIALAPLFPCLNGDREVVFSFEPEAQHDMCNGFPSPINSHQIDGVELV